MHEQAQAGVIVARKSAVAAARYTVWIFLIGQIESFAGAKDASRALSNTLPRIAVSQALLIVTSWRNGEPKSVVGG